MRKGRAFALSLFWLIFLVGFGLVLYPYGNGAYTYLRQQQDAQSFLTQLGNDDDAGEAVETLPTETAEIDPLLEAARAYNNSLAANGQAMTSSSAFTEAPLNLADYGYDDIFAVLRIPAIDLEMPVYLGASYVNLAKGACVMGQTSLPIGGESTNCVIAGHRGWKGATMFKQVPSLKIGDRVTITNPWETLTYEVTEKQTISSSDCEKIRIRSGKDLITLFTCDYTASGVKLRSLVICSRAAEQ